LIMRRREETITEISTINSHTCTLRNCGSSHHTPLRI